jgi:hypothetical protein
MLTTSSKNLIAVSCLVNPHICTLSCDSLTHYVISVFFYTALT